MFNLSRPLSSLALLHLHPVAAYGIAAFHLSGLLVIHPDWPALDRRVPTIHWSRGQALVHLQGIRIWTCCWSHNWCQHETIDWCHHVHGWFLDVISVDSVERHEARTCHEWSQVARLCGAFASSSTWAEATANTGQASADATACAASISLPSSKQHHQHQDGISRWCLYDFVCAAGCLWVAQHHWNDYWNWLERRFSTAGCESTTRTPNRSWRTHCHGAAFSWPRFPWITLLHHH